MYATFPNTDQKQKQMADIIIIITQLKHQEVWSNV